MAVLQDSTGAIIAAVKAASTPAIATDPALVTTPSPNGIQVIGSGGIAMGMRPDGFMRNATDPTTLLYDSFETLDTTNTWTVSGTTLPTGVTGLLTFPLGVAANASSYAQSQPRFQPGSSAFLQAAYLVAFLATVETGSKRFFGLGLMATTPTASIPITNGSTFELDSTGALFGAVYSNSVRTASIALVRPTDGLQHRYSLYYKASRVYFEIDNLPVGSIGFPNPVVSQFSIVIGVINDTAAVAVQPTMTSALVGVADTGKNSNKLSDGRFPWRYATVSAAGELSVLQQLLIKGTQNANGLSTQDLKDAGRTLVHYYTLVPVATAAVDTLLSLNGTKGTTAVAATATPAVVTAAKTFRITRVSAQYVSSAVTGFAVVRLRSQPAGIVTVTSNVIGTCVAGNAGPATANAVGSTEMLLEEGMEVPAGTGIGISAQGFAAAVGAAVGSVMVSVSGYEY